MEKESKHGEDGVLLITYQQTVEIISDAFEPEPADFEQFDEPEPTQARQPDKMDLLYALLQKSSKEEIAGLVAKMMPPEKKTHKGTPHHSKVTEHKVITVHSFCRNCDATHIYTTELAKGQHKSWIRKNGSVGYVECKKNFQPMVVQSWHTTCCQCKYRIGRWSREQLEDRYMQLLKRLAYEPLPTTLREE